MPPTKQTPYRKKLIEVDLPLDAINKESSREKSIRHGHPSTLHLWWARRPLAACRAVIFASMVDDPSSCPEEYPDIESQNAKRDELHQLIEQLVKWENSNDETLLGKARKEIAISVARSRNETAPENPKEVLNYLRDHAPTIHDPFCGGGSIPLEAQRLGMKAIGSDLNPVAVLITKALIELPPKFANQPPINPDADRLGMTTGKGRNKQRIPWRGAAGLADDIRYYGKWMRDEAFKRIGHLYPKVNLPDGSKATVIAWLWARTIPCANPACGINMPMMKTFQLSKKRNNPHWIRPIIDRDAKSISFQVQTHNRDVPKDTTVNRNGATCIACGNTVKLNNVREQAKAGNMTEEMVAIVAQGDRKRLFLSPNDEHIQAANDAAPSWRPTQTITKNPKVSALSYGITHWHQLFTQRQLLTLTTFSDLIPEVKSLIIDHDSDKSYADAVCTYLTLAIGRASDSGSSYARWQNSGDFVAGVFARQAIPMMWDFAETNTFSQKTQNWLAQIDWIAKAVEHVPAEANSGNSIQVDASTNDYAANGQVIVTDPPYYDNISYADLSDFFYVWLRPLLRDTYPDVFSGILTPKSEEMIAAPRFSDPRRRFEDSLLKTSQLIRQNCNKEIPSSIFYAYKQQEEQRGGQASTGWETMLNSVIRAGFQIVHTWPMRTERSARSNALSANSLASSVVLVCRPRQEDAIIATRQEFLDELDTELRIALRSLTRDGHIAPADLPQSAIGPGMEIYSKYSRVETISGEPVTVREALQQINRVIGEYIDQQEGELDSVSRFCIDWVKIHSYNEGPFGDAENIARPQGISVSDIANIHDLIKAERGTVELAPISEYKPDRKYPMTDMTAWEGCMRMAYHLDTGNEDGEGVEGCGDVGRRMAGNIDSVERLARILYNHYDNLNQPRDAYIYNQLVSEWQNILDATQSPATPTLV